MSQHRVYRVDCSDSDCGTHITSDTTQPRRSFEKEIRESGWGTSKGYWYCPKHKPSRGGDKDTAPQFAYHWGLLAKHAPAPLPEFKFDPTRDYSSDYGFPEFRLLVEIDGGQYLIRRGKNGRIHAGGKHNTDEDRKKLNRAAVLGFKVIRFSTQMLENDPGECVNIVLEALGLDRIEY